MEVLPLGLRWVRTASAQMQWVRFGSINTPSKYVPVRVHSDCATALSRGRVFTVSAVATVSLIGILLLPGAPVVSVIPVLDSV